MLRETLTQVKKKEDEQSTNLDVTVRTKLQRINSFFINSVNTTRFDRSITYL